jgi:carbon storage regulator
MLVVTRKQGESLLIGDNIEITIIEMEGSNIKIGINAPRNIKILRKELIKEVRQENVESISRVGDLLKRLK